MYLNKIFNITHNFNSPPANACYDGFIRTFETSLKFSQSKLKISTSLCPYFENLTQGKDYMFYFKLKISKRDTRHKDYTVQKTSYLFPVINTTMKFSFEEHFSIFCQSREL